MGADSGPSVQWIQESPGPVRHVVPNPDLGPCSLSYELRSSSTTLELNARSIPILGTLDLLPPLDHVGPTAIGPVMHFVPVRLCSNSHQLLRSGTGTLCLTHPVRRSQRCTVDRVTATEGCELHHCSKNCAPVITHLFLGSNWVWRKLFII